MNCKKLLLPLLILGSASFAEARLKDLGVEDMKRLSLEATKQMTHCEKLQGGLKVAVEDFKNLTSEHVDRDLFTKTLNEALENLGPSKKTAEALAALPGGEGTRLFAEVGSASMSKGRRQTAIYTLSIYAKEGDRQICKVTSELTKSSSSSKRK